MTLEVIQIILLALVNLSCITLGVWVLKSASKGKLNQWFVVMAAFILLWVNTSYLGFHAASAELATFWYRLNGLAVFLFLFSFYYFFVAKFLKRKRPKVLDLSILLGSLVFSSISVLTDLIIKKAEIHDWGSEIFFGQAEMALNIFALLWAVIIFYYAISSYFSLPKVEKLRVKYFFFGIVTFVLANIVFNMIVPQVLNTSKYQQFGDFSFIFFLGFTAYAIVRHRLMDIRLIVARSLAFLLLIISVAGMAGLFMMTLPHYIFSPETLEKYNIPIRSAVGIVMIFLFQPLRRWITIVTDRIFFKNEYDLNDLLKKITNNAYSTLILIELLYKTVDILIKEMKVSKGMFILLDPSGDIHTTQAIGYQKTPEIKPKDVKGLSIHGTIVYDDLDESTHFKRVLKKSEASVSIGLAHDDKPIGILLLGEKSSGDMFNKKDLTFLEIFAPEMVVAIQRAEEHEKVQNFNVYLQAEVARKTRELQDANEHLKELDKAKDEFISMASHQLRTPLTAIKGYLSMLMEGDAGDLKMAQYDFVNEAFEGANRMVSLINDLLNVSRMDTGRFFLEPKNVDLKGLVEQEIKQLSNSAKDKRLFLELQAKKDLPKVTADETKIRQVVMNFMDNAIYYTMSGGVTITLEKEKESVIFKVKDTGMGVPEVEKHNLFTKFYRADNARKIRPDGTGLGIYLAKKVIEDHGGEIIFESEEGKGSVFGFKLPIKSKIKKEITIPPPDLATQVEGIGSGPGREIKNEISLKK